MEQVRLEDLGSLVAQVHTIPFHSTTPRHLLSYNNVGRGA
jgi:hypothetical protein